MIRQGSTAAGAASNAAWQSQVDDEKERLSIFFATALPAMAGGYR
jgi:hypothetical protein